MRRLDLIADRVEAGLVRPKHLGDDPFPAARIGRRVDEFVAHEKIFERRVPHLRRGRRPQVGDGASADTAPAQRAEFPSMFRRRF